MIDFDKGVGEHFDDITDLFQYFKVVKYTIGIMMNCIIQHKSVKENVKRTTFLYHIVYHLSNRCGPHYIGGAPLLLDRWYTMWYKNIVSLALIYPFVNYTN